jgi:hypothetical protein
MPVRWFTLTVKNSFPVIGTGFSGSITFPFEMPIWLLLAASTVATLMIALNIVEVTSVPKTIPALLLLLCEAFYLGPIFVNDKELTLAVGPFLATLATAVALFALFINHTGVDQSLPDNIGC